MDRRFEYRSFFWPILMIGIGVMWLLGNLGLIPALNFWLLLRLWPLILIVIGLDILIGRRSSLAGALIGLGALAVVVAVLVAGPRLGLERGTEVKTERFVEPVGQAASARIRLDLSESTTEVKALASQENLIDAEITHLGEMNFQVSGSSEKTISLGRRPGTNWGFSFAEQQWKIGLAPDLPLALVVDGGSGSTRLDLTGLKLAELNVERGSGSFTILLPESGEAYQASIEGGSGSLDLSLPAGTPLTVRLYGGSGGQSLTLPSGAAVRIEVRDSGSGGVSLPSGLEQVEDQDDDEGVWESAGYQGAADKILIIVEELGSGSIHFR